MTTAASASGVTTDAASTGTALTVAAAASTTTAANGAASTTTPAGQAENHDAGLIGDGAPDAAAAAKAVADAPITITLPEGMKADDKLLDAFKPLAKELGLKSEGAQKLVDIYSARVQEMVKADADAFVERQKAWKETVKSDKELGGQNFETSLADVKRVFAALDKDGSIRKEIAALGLGNHPAIVRLAVRAAKLVKEDGIGGVGAGSGEASEEDLLRMSYPSMFPKQ